MFLSFIQSATLCVSCFHLHLLSCDKDASKRQILFVISHMVSYLSPGTEIPICGLLFLCVCLSGAGLRHALDEQLCSPPTLSSRLHTVSSHLMSLRHTHLWVFIVLLLTFDHLIPCHGAFSHADQDMDVVGILMRNWKDEGKLQTAVYTARNFLFQL